MYLRSTLGNIGGYGYNVCIMGNEKGNSAVMAVLVLAVLAIAAWVAYTQGVFTGKQQASPEPTTIEINLPGSSSNPSPTPRY